MLVKLSAFKLLEHRNAVRPIAAFRVAHHDARLFSQSKGVLIDVIKRLNLHWEDIRILSEDVVELVLDLQLFGVHRNSQRSFELGVVRTFQVRVRGSLAQLWLLLVLNYFNDFLRLALSHVNFGDELDLLDFKSFR